MTPTNPTRASLRRLREARRARLRRAGGATLATLALAATLVATDLGDDATAAPAHDAAPAAGTTAPAAHGAPVPGATPQAITKAGQVLSRADFAVRESPAGQAQRAEIAKTVTQLRKLVERTSAGAPVAAHAPAAERRGAAASRAGERGAPASALRVSGGGGAGGRLAETVTGAAAPSLADRAGLAPTQSLSRTAAGRTPSLPGTLPEALLQEAEVPAEPAAAQARENAGTARASEPRTLDSKAEAELTKTTQALESMLKSPTATAAVEVAPRPVPKPKPKPKAAARPAATGQQAAPSGIDRGRAAKAARAAAGARNGRVPAEALCELPFARGEQLRCDAVEALARLDAAYRAQFGTHLSINDSYRSFEAQVAVKASRGFWAATPGYSNHGWGVAVDLGGGVQQRSSAQHAWMVKNAGRFGWRNPDWAQADGRKPEAWHWEYGTHD